MLCVQKEFAYGFNPIKKNISYKDDQTTPFQKHCPLKKLKTLGAADPNLRLHFLLSTLQI